MRKYLASFLAVVLSGGILLVALLLPLTVASQGQGIQADGASARRDIDTTGAAALEETFASVQPRTVVQAAASLREFALVQSTELEARMTAVAPRIVVHAPATLNQKELVFPRELIGDETPPAVNNEVQVGSTTETTATITLETTEFARVVMRYGFEPGNLDQEVQIVLFARRHTIEISIPPGQQTLAQNATTLYYQLEIEDLSGNTTTTPEATLELTPESNQQIYLPLVVREM